jgi:hypothetical protein
MRTTTKFKVGDKVRRININCESSAYKRIAYGKTYTVRKVDIYGNLDEKMDIVYLNGFHTDEGMWAERFVKVQRK